MPRFSGYEGPIITEEVVEAIADCGVGKAPGLDDLPYVLCKSMSDLFGYLLAGVYTTWQKNACIPRSVQRGVVTLVKENSDKKDSID